MQQQTHWSYLSPPALSFTFVDSKEFKKMILDVQKLAKSLPPDVYYEPPSAFVVSNRLLDEAYEKRQNKMQGRVERSSGAAVSLDGRTNIRHEHMLDFTITIPEENPIYVKTIKTNGEVQDAPRVASEIETTIVAVGVHKVDLVVTDNPNVMKAAWKIVEERNPLVSCNGCACHVFNLLVRSKDHEETTHDAESIISFVNNHHRVLAMYESLMESENITRKLTTPIKTRWFSYHGTFYSIKHSKSLLQRLVRENKRELLTITPRPNSKKFVDKINSSAFWTKVDKILDEITFPSNLIGKLERNDATSEQVLESFIDLRNHYVHAGNVEAARLVVTRFNFIVNDHLRVAYLLNHQKVMNGIEYMPGDEVNCMTALANEAMRFEGENLKAETFKELSLFHRRMANLTSLEKLTLAQMKSPAYWNVLGKSEFPSLAFLASKLLGPASAASTERAWSIYRWIHSRLRNRLSLAKIDKLAFIIINDDIEFTDFSFGDELMELT